MAGVCSHRMLPRTPTPSCYTRVSTWRCTGCWECAPIVAAAGLAWVFFQDTKKRRHWESLAGPGAAVVGRDKEQLQLQLEGEGEGVEESKDGGGEGDASAVASVSTNGASGVPSQAHDGSKILTSVDVSKSDMLKIETVDGDERLMYLTDAATGPWSAVIWNSMWPPWLRSYSCHHTTTTSFPACYALLVVQTRTGRQGMSRVASFV